MREQLAARPPNRQGQLAAQARLLTALEDYTSALSARGLAAPPTLRDELALQRGLAGQ